ncbi:MAG: glycosyltransferase family 2 protein [Candidatus Aquicultorales bacterium]
MDISVILPVYKNRDTIEELYDRLAAVLKGFGVYEIVFVDDCCPQSSYEAVENLALSNPAVKLLRMGENVGQQRAVVEGLAVSTGRTVVIMDADLQDPPEAIPLLVDALETGYEAVFAGRCGRYESSVRLLTSKVFKKALSLMCGIPADAGIYMALSRRVADRLVALDEPTPFVVAMVGCTGLPMLSIPVPRNERPVGKSSYTTWKRLKVALNALSRVPYWKKALREMRHCEEHVQHPTIHTTT